MAVEGKGFVIKDKRSFDEAGELRDTSEVQESKEKESKEEVKTEEKRQERAATEDTQRPPLPEVNFNSLILSLSSSAFLHLGEIADPQTGERKKDLPLAKHSIDIIAMLKEKTKGNLLDEERQFIENILTDLRIRFVKASKKS